jgi:hypothetical protein
MDLKFPNARLFLHGLLLADRVSGAQAIAEGACQFGLISADCVPDVVPATKDHSCQCLTTGKNVLRKHFEHRAGQVALPQVDYEEVWLAIARHILGDSQAAKFEPGGTGDGQMLAGACHKHAPALFDLILQQIMRYP